MKNWICGAGYYYSEHDTLDQALEHRRTLPFATHVGPTSKMERRLDVLARAADPMRIGARACNFVAAPESAWGYVEAKQAASELHRAFPTAHVPQVRRIITIVRTMQARWGWDRRRAIRFALEQVRRNPAPPAPRKHREMSDDTREYLDHKNRSTSR